MTARTGDVGERARHSELRRAGGFAATGRAGTLDLAVAIVDAGDALGVIVRVLGGVGVALHCPSSGQGPFLREYGDLDVVVDRRGGRKQADALFASLGYQADVEFNTMNGPEGRRRYLSTEHGKVDVFVGAFRMCHELPLEERLTADAPTVPLADLFLTKAQIFEMTEKDALDLACLLLDHDLAEHDDDCIDVRRVARLTGADWGLWRTVTRSLDRLRTTVDGFALAPEQRAAIAARIDALQAELDEAPKSTKWKLRARVGDHVRWYELPEDPDRAA
jgi:hypothetical protein